VSGDAKDAMERAVRYAAFVCAVEQARDEWERTIKTGGEVRAGEVLETIEALGAAYGEDAWVWREGICVERGGRIDVFEISKELSEKLEISGEDEGERFEDEMLETLDDEDYLERRDGI